MAEANQSTVSLPSPEKPNNYLSSLTTLLTSTLGITILLMPKLFHQGGIVFCSIQILTMGLAIYLASSMLCSCAFATRSTSYYETIVKICGPYKWGPSVFYILLLCGNILVYHAFVLKNLIPMVNTLFGFNYAENTSPYTGLAVVLTILSHLLILPFIFSRKLRIVKKISNFCSLAVALSIVIIILAFFRPSLFDLPDKPINWRFVDYYKFDGLYVCVGYYLLSFTFQQILIEVSHEINPRTPYSTDLILFSNCMISVFLYVVVSFAGYLAVYSEQNLDGMNNYITYLIVDLRNRNEWLFVTNFLVLLNVTFANILNYIPTIKFLNAVLNFKRKKEVQESDGSGAAMRHPESPDTEEARVVREQMRKLKNRILVWALFFIVMFFSLITIVLNLKMDTIFNLVSAVGGPIVLLVIPSLFYILLMQRGVIKTQGWVEYAIAGTVLTLGVSIWIVSIYAVFIE